MKKFLLVSLLVTTLSVHAMDEQNGHTLTEAELHDGSVYTMSDFVKNIPTNLEFVKGRPRSFNLTRNDHAGSVYQTIPKQGKAVQLFYNSNGDLEGFEAVWVGGNVQDQEPINQDKDNDSAKDSKKKRKSFYGYRGRSLPSIFKYVKKNKIKVCLLGTVLSVIAYVVYSRVVNNQKTTVSRGYG